MAIIYKWRGQILRRRQYGNRLAKARKCCCVPLVGCCEGKLIASEPTSEPPIVGTILEAEVIADTTGCVPVGNKIQLDDVVSQGIWSSNRHGPAGHLSTPNWGGLYLVCDTSTQPNRLLLHWGEAVFCPETDTSPEGAFAWTLVAGQCNPIDFTYTYTINENPDVSACGCFTGTITVRVRVKP